MIATIFSSRSASLISAFGEHFGVAGRTGGCLLLLAGQHIEFRNAVKFVGGRFGRRIALALLRHDMNEHRSTVGVAHILQHRDQVIEIMSVDRPDIIESQFLEQRAAHPEAAGIFLDAPRGHLEHAWKAPRHALHRMAKTAIGAAGNQPRKIGAHRAHRRRDRHVVVVQDDDQPLAHCARIVHRLIGHAGAHRAVADDANHVVLLAREIARHGKAQARGNRGRGMGRAERVVGTFGALGETGKPAALAQRPHPRAPPGQNLVRIGLMADIPDQLVARRVEDAVQCDRQFDHAKPRAQMAARHRNHIDGLVAQFVGQLLQRFCWKRPKICGIMDRIQQRGFEDKFTELPEFPECFNYACRRTTNKGGSAQKIGLLVEQIKVRSGLGYQCFGLCGSPVTPQKRRHRWLPRQLKFPAPKLSISEAI